MARRRIVALFDWAGRMRTLLVQMTGAGRCAGKKRGGNTGAPKKRFWRVYNLARSEAENENNDNLENKPGIHLLGRRPKNAIKEEEGQGKKAEGNAEADGRRGQQ